MSQPSARRPIQRKEASDQHYIGDLGRRHRPDYILGLCILALLVVGLMVMYSVSPALSAQLGEGVDPNHFMNRHIRFLFIGAAAFFVMGRVIQPKWWVPLQKFVLIGAVVSFLLLFIPAFNIEHGGATRWVRLGPINYQPAEVLKFGLVFAMAGFFAKRAQNNTLNSITTSRLFLAILALVAIEIVIIQKDLGTMVPIAAILMIMFYLSGVSMKRFAAVAGVILIAGTVAIAGAGHRRERLFTFLNPEVDITGSGYHINQALIAVGSGGVFGKGLGQSVQAYGYLPEAANDSIFAIMAEKFGLFGLIIIFTIYGVLLFRILTIMRRAPNYYLQFVAGGIFAWISIQAFVNVGAMLSIMPLTGVTLPLLSFGGTSLVFMMAALGAVFHVSRYTVLGSNSSLSTLGAPPNREALQRRRV